MIRKTLSKVLDSFTMQWLTHKNCPCHSSHLKCILCISAWYLHTQCSSSFQKSLSEWITSSHALLMYSFWYLAHHRLWASQWFVGFVFTSRFLSYLWTWLNRLWLSDEKDSEAYQEDYCDWLVMPAERGTVVTLYLVMTLLSASKENQLELA